METNTTPHYLTVSLWAVSAASDAQSVSADYGSFQIQFSSAAWNVGLLTNWASPT
jgi:hypothetical protein